MGHKPLNRVGSGERGEGWSPGGGWSTAMRSRRSRWWAHGSKPCPPQPTTAHLSEEGSGARALEPLGCHECLLPSGPPSDAARALGGGTRPVPPVRARRSCCTSSSWSSRGTWASPCRGLVGWWLGWGMACSGVCRGGLLGWVSHSAGACREIGVPGPKFPRQESSHTFRVFPVRHLARSAPD